MFVKKNKNSDALLINSTQLIIYTYLSFHIFSIEYIILYTLIFDLFKITMNGIILLHWNPEIGGTNFMKGKANNKVIKNYVMKREAILYRSERINVNLPKYT